MPAPVLCPYCKVHVWTSCKANNCRVLPTMLTVNEWLEEQKVEMVQEQREQVAAALREQRKTFGLDEVVAAPE